MRIIINGQSVTVPGGINSQQVSIAEVTEQTSAEPLLTTTCSASLDANVVETVVRSDPNA